MACTSRGRSARTTMSRASTTLVSRPATTASRPRHHGRAELGGIEARLDRESSGRGPRWRGRREVDVGSVDHRDPLRAVRALADDDFGDDDLAGGVRPERQRAERDAGRTRLADVVVAIDRGRARRPASVTGIRAATPRPASPTSSRTKGSRRRRQKPFRSTSSSSRRVTARTRSAPGGRESWVMPPESRRRCDVVKPAARQTVEHVGRRRKIGDATEAGSGTRRRR